MGKSEKPQCWNCKRSYDSIFYLYGAIAGECHRCASIRWIVPPSEFEKAGFKIEAADYTPAEQKDIKEYMNRIKAAKHDAA